MAILRHDWPRSSIGRTACLDSIHWGRIPRRLGRTESAPGFVDYDHRSVRLTRGTSRPWLLRLDAGNAIGPLRNVHRTKFHSLVPLLRDEPHPIISADQALGW